MLLVYEKYYHCIRNSLLNEEKNVIITYRIFLSFKNKCYCIHFTFNKFSTVSRQLKSISRNLKKRFFIILDDSVAYCLP